jgi:acyl dehydratase
MDEVNACSIFLAIMSGLRDSSSIPHGIMMSHHFEIVAALSAGAEFIEPVKDDDTIFLETRLVGARASRSQPDRGIMEITEECLNQHNTVLVRRHRAFLFCRTLPQVD